MVIGFDIRRSDALGVGTYIKGLVRAFVRQGAGRQFVLIGAPRHRAAFDGLPPSFTFVPCGLPYGSLGDHLRFHFLLRKLHCDVIHIPHRAVPYLMPRPYVVTVHDLDQVLFRENPLSKLRAEQRFHVLRHGFARAARLITVSSSTRDDLVRLLGIPGDRIEVVHNAIDEELLEPDSEEDRLRVLERYQVNYPFLLYVGAIQPQKNLARLVEAFAVVQAELERHPLYSELRLIIIGDGLDPHPDLRRAVIRSRAQHRVRFLGFVPAETLRLFYRSASAFVFPSLYEGFGLPPLEAMAQNVPVITSNVSSLPEVVGDAAVFVNPENVFDIARGIRQTLLDNELRAECCARGRRQAARFSWDRAAGRVLAIYEQAVEGGNASRNPKLRVGAAG